MQLYFIRHGQSLNNAEWLLTGEEPEIEKDPDLTLLGREQSRILARYVQDGTKLSPYLKPGLPNPLGFHITHIYASPMIRTLETAKFIATQLNMPLLVCTTIFECGAENYNLRRHTYKRTRDYNYTNKSSDCDEPLGVSTQSGIKDQCRIRAYKFLSTLYQKHNETNDGVIVVGHGDFYDIFMHVLLEIPLTVGCHFSLNNASITRIDFNNGSFCFIYQNRFDHLPPNLVTT